jgi:hypothetical protein
MLEILLKGCSVVCWDEQWVAGECLKLAVDFFRLRIPVMRMDQLKKTRVFRKSSTIQSLLLFSLE